MTNHVTAFAVFDVGGGCCLVFMAACGLARSFKYCSIDLRRVSV